MDTSKKISDCKLQKRVFDSAKQLKCKEFKYDSNPSMHCHLFQSFYNQLLLLTYIGMHFKTILQRKETNRFGDKVVIALQEQVASITSVEQNTTQRNRDEDCIMRKPILLSSLLFGCKG
jgi:hypothetical protein